LVELLTVITIIVILAGLTVIALTWMPRMAHTKKAVAQKELLDSAMFRYHADTGVYPVALDGTGLTMYYVLYGDGVGPDGIRGTADDGPVDGRPDDGATVYLEQLNPATNPLGLLDGPPGAVPTRLVDPFGNAWHYGGGRENWPQMNNRNFDIHSPGPDGVGTPTDPGPDDIHNW
jgi:type II secretory pathway pseudopilin PulG